MSQFCLKWNNHVPNMLSVFEKLKFMENFVDVTLACEGRLLKAHKLVLSAGSEFFHNIFLANPCKHPVIVMHDVKYNILKAIIEFMYKGEINVTHDNLQSLLKTAKTLDVKGLAEICKESARPESFDSQENSQYSSLNSAPLPLESSQHLQKRRRNRLRKRSFDSTFSNDEVIPKIEEPSSPECIEPVDFPPIKVTESCSLVVPNTISTPGSSNEKFLNSNTNSIPLATSKELGEQDQVSERECQVEPFRILEQSLTTEQVETSSKHSFKAEEPVQNVSNSETSVVHSVPTDSLSSVQLMDQNDSEGAHYPDVVPPTLKRRTPCRRCAVCSEKRDENGRKVRKETRYYCKDCDVGLCVAPCFKLYHTQQKLLKKPKKKSCPKKQKRKE